MDNKVYYGEYSLNCWLDLMLKLEIVMPEYQRRFVWQKEQVEKLINSMKNNEFVPPIIIGSCTQNGQKYNYIIDGQQRLTAILFAKIGYILDPKAWEKETEILLTDSSLDDDDDDEIDNQLTLWRYSNLLSSNPSNNTITGIIESCKSDEKKYIPIDLKCDDEFFEKTYLGFSYLLPQGDNEIEQHRYYSTIFRNINFQGVELQAEESREALYFWNKERTYWFKPNFAQRIHGKTKNGIAHMDFVRYMSILSDYNKLDASIMQLFKGYKLIWEEYYEQYIYSVAQNIDDARFGAFSSIFKTDEVAQNSLKNVNQLINNLGWQTDSYDTTIKMDIYFFGLFYYVIFKKYTFSDLSKKDELKQLLDEKWQSYDDKHRRSPRAKKYLRTRIHDSIEIYRKFFTSGIKISLKI